MGEAGVAAIVVNTVITELTVRCQLVELHISRDLNFLLSKWPSFEKFNYFKPIRDLDYFLNNKSEHCHNLNNDTL